jgi:hypothetical protein
MIVFPNNQPFDGGSDIGWDEKGRVYHYRRHGWRLVIWRTWG